MASACLLAIGLSLVVAQDSYEPLDGLFELVEDGQHGLVDQFIQFHELDREDARSGLGLSETVLFNTHPQLAKARHAKVLLDGHEKRFALLGGSTIVVSLHEPSRRQLRMRLEESVFSSLHFEGVDVLPLTEPIRYGITEPASSTESYKLEASFSHVQEDVFVRLIAATKNPHVIDYHQVQLDHVQALFPCRNTDKGKDQEKDAGSKGLVALKLARTVPRRFAFSEQHLVHYLYFDVTGHVIWSVFPHGSPRLALSHASDGRGHGHAAVAPVTQSLVGSAKVASGGVTTVLTHADYDTSHQRADVSELQHLEEVFRPAEMNIIIGLTVVLLTSLISYAVTHLDDLDVSVDSVHPVAANVLSSVNHKDPGPADPQEATNDDAQDTASSASSLLHPNVVILKPILRDKPVIPGENPALHSSVLQQHPSYQTSLEKPLLPLQATATMYESSDAPKTPVPVNIILFLSSSLLIFIP